MKEDINKFLAKLSAVILVGLLLVVGIDCLIGFTLGGKIGILHVALFFIASFVLGTLASIFLYIKDRVIEMPKTAIITSMAIFFLVLCLGYGGINSISKSSDYLEYQTVISYVETPYKTFHNNYYFEDLNGERQVFRRIMGTGVDYEYGDKINVKEYQGGFGYPVYEISIIKE